MHSKINGNPTVALDFSSFEASVMYTLVGEVMEMNDPYYVGIDGYDPQLERHILKRCFMVMMNSSSRLQAMATMRHWLESEDFNIETLYKKRLIPEKRLSAKVFINAMEKKHSKVKDYFYSGKNEDFNIQNITAEINDFIVGYLFGQCGIMVGQVHDCFIVEQQHKDILMQTMFHGYEIVLGDVANCRVTQEF